MRLEPRHGPPRGFAGLCAIAGVLGYGEDLRFTPVIETMFRYVRLAGIVVMIGMLVPGAVQTAWAQAVTGGEGIVNAVSFSAIPEELVIEVTLYDNTDLDLAIRDEMIEALEGAKHAVSDGAPYELSLETDEEAINFSSKDPSLGEISSVGGGLDVELNVWSSTKDSLLGGRQERTVRQGENHFEIHAVLRDRQAGGVVWEGRATVQGDRGSAGPITRKMVDSLVANLGRTVDDGTFLAR
jgi:hypothetical protein